MIGRGWHVRGDERMWIVKDFVQPSHFIQQAIDGFGAEQRTQPLVHVHDQVSGLPASIDPGLRQKDAHHAPVVGVGPALNPANFFQPSKGTGQTGGFHAHFGAELR